MKKHHPQHTTPSKNTKRYNKNNINNSMETPAAPLSSFNDPEVGDKFIDKECIHRYVCEYIRFTNRNIAPTSENNKARIRFACKHEGCLFDLLFMKPVRKGESGDFVIKKFVGHSPECPKLESSSLIINKKARYISSNYMEKTEGCKKIRTGRKH